jgi:hypothetical protein
MSCSRALPRSRKPRAGPRQSVADTLESIQKARVVTRVLFIVAHCAVPSFPAAMNVEGPHLYFTRVTDFGFSKTLEETLEKWNGVELEDMVRVIRTVRPNIVVNGWGGTHTGHGNHQDSGYQTPKAVEAAADPTKYPDQIAEGT